MKEMMKKFSMIGGTKILFIPSETNTGDVFINSIKVKRKDKVPIKAGDIIEGLTYLVDKETGELI